MPIYEYRRPDGSTFEIVQSFSDEPLSSDPDTGVPVERVLHAPAVHFKGKGFYNTDYGTRKRQRETAAASSEESSGQKDASADGPSKTGEGRPSEGAATSANGKAPDGKPTSERSSAKDAKPVAAKT